LALATRAAGELPGKAGLGHIHAERMLVVFATEIRHGQVSRANRSQDKHHERQAGKCHAEDGPTTAGGVKSILKNHAFHGGVCFALFVQQCREVYYFNPFCFQRA
jgi:hypothetical protein